MYKLKNKKGKQRGITLVALVVTIVVLLILAGVTINAVFSDNGIVKQAQEAANATKNAQENTIRDLENLQEEINKMIQGVKKGEINEDKNAIYTDSTGTAVIPAGFCVVKDSGGNINTVANGLVISDVANDDLDNSKGGNQFIWVPVDGSTLKYEQHVYQTKYVNDTYSIADTGNGGWKTFNYRMYAAEDGSTSGWEDKGGNKESVAKYKGFYIGRFEAGMPDSGTEPFKAPTGDSKYYQASNQNNDLGTNYAKSSDSGKSYANTYTTAKNTDAYAPVSKKNNQSWNYISQTNAKAASTKMYSASTSVTSSLIDSYAWDTVTQWLSNSGYDVTNSKEWGNYYNSSFNINGLYAKHQWKSGTDSNIRWYPAYTWNYGNYSRSDAEYTETATGSVERNKAKNIYDFAGNMWEWTTEEGTNESSTKNHAVIRGGSFYANGDDYPASCRNGWDGLDSTYLDFGFRVVLYIK